MFQLTNKQASKEIMRFMLSPELPYEGLAKQPLKPSSVQARRVRSGRNVNLCKQLIRIKTKKSNFKKGRNMRNLKNFKTQKDQMI